MTQGPSILMVGLESPRRRVGGLNRYLEALAGALRAGGTEVEVVWVAENDEPGAVAVGPALSWPARLWRFARVVRSSSAELIDVHFAAHAYLALRLGALRRRPLLVHFQGPWAEESRTAGGGRWGIRVKSHLEGYVLRRADRVIVLSGAFRQVAVTRYGVCPARIEVVAPGVDLAVRVDRAAARGRLGIAEGETLLVMVRRLVPRMGHEVALEALHRRAREDERLVIVGEGPLRETLEARAAALEVADRVTFTGLVDDAVLADWYQAADATLVPSLAHEGYGLVVLESLAAGTPVVASRVDGLRDAGRGMSAVRLVEPTGEALSDGLDAVLGRPGLRGAARREVRSRSWSAVAERHVGLYRATQAGPEPRLAVVLDHCARLSGGELALARLLPAVDADWRVHVVLAEHGPLEDVLERRGVSFEVLELDERTRSVSRGQIHIVPAAAALHTISYALRLRWLLARRRPEIVHTNSMKAHVYGSLASVGARWRLLLHVRDQWAPPYISRHVAVGLRRLARWAPDAVVANSSDTARHIGRVARVLASPVEERFFHVPPPSTSAQLRLAVVGRLAPWKGQDLAIEALALLQGGHAPGGDGPVASRLVVAGVATFGEDEFAASLVERAAELGVADSVEFLGFVEDVAALLVDVDVVVLSSRSPEPFGNVVVEAMAAGRVVVVPNRGGVTEFVLEGGEFGNGFFYEMGSAEDLARVLASLAGRVELRRSVGAEARQAARAFRPSPLARELEAVYDSLV